MMAVLAFLLTAPGRRARAPAPGLVLVSASNIHSSVGLMWSAVEPVKVWQKGWKINESEKQEVRHPLYVVRNGVVLQLVCESTRPDDSAAAGMLKKTWGNARGKGGCIAPWANDVILPVGGGFGGGGVMVV